MDRYQELKKENNQTAYYLGDQYRNVAQAYIKRARSYAARTEDTEVKIKDTLEYLTNLDNNHVNINAEIPNVDKFIEERLALLSKRYYNKEYIKGLIIAIVLVVIAIGWLVVSKILARDVRFITPTNLNATVNGTQVTLTWDEVELANSYTIYYVDSNGNRSSSYLEYENKIVLNLAANQTYTIYLYVTETEHFLKSQEVSITVTTTN